MRSLIILIVCMMVTAISGSCVSAEQIKDKTVSIFVSTEDTLLDGTPSEFDIKKFTSKFRKQLVSKLGDKGFTIVEDKSDYIIKVSIESMRHKLKPFRFKSSYIIDYKYELYDSNMKELLNEDDDKSNKDLIDLIDDATGEIVDNITDNKSLYSVKNNGINTTRGSVSPSFTSRPTRVESEYDAPAPSGTVTPNAYGLGVGMDATGRPVTVQPAYPNQGGYYGDSVIQKRDAYGPGVSMDQYGRPVQYR